MAMFSQGMFGGSAGGYAVGYADGYAIGWLTGYDIGGTMQHDFDNHVVASPPADFLKTLTNYGMGEAGYLPWTTPAGGFTWNPDCWFPGLDLTGIGSYISANGRWYSATAISRRHVLACQHVSLPIGGKMYFINPTGGVHVATIVSRQQVGTSDHYVGYLDADLPAAHTFYRLLDPNYDDYLIFDPTDLSDTPLVPVAPDGICGKPMLVFDQQRKMFLARFWKFSTPTHFTAAVHGPKYPLRVQYFPEGLELGDSGAPHMLLLDRELILIGTNHYALGVGYANAQECLTAAQQAGINAAMVALDAAGTGYTLSICSLDRQTYTEGYDAGGTISYTIGYTAGFAAAGPGVSALDLSGDQNYIDGLESITLDGETIPNVYRLEEDVVEQQPSDGVYLSRNTEFQLPVDSDLYSKDPSVGGLIVDDAGDAYVILSVRQSFSPDRDTPDYGDFWGCVCRSMALVDTYNLDDQVTLWPAVETLDDWGSKGTTHPAADGTFFQIAAKIMLQPSRPELAAGQRDFLELYEVYVDREIGQVHAGDLLIDQNSHQYTIVSYRNRQRIDELSVILCEERLRA